MGFKSLVEKKALINCFAFWYRRQLIFDIPIRSSKLQLRVCGFIWLGFVSEIGSLSARTVAWKTINIPFSVSFLFTGAAHLHKIKFNFDWHIR